MSTPSPSPRSRRRRPLFWILFAVFVVVPLVEIYVLVQVGQVIGAGWTIALLVLDSLVGGYIIRREGGRAWRDLRVALNAGRMPATELADGALILIGGTLMLAPGFVTDAAGLALILPVTRPLFRRVIAGRVARRLIAPAGGATTFGFGQGFGPGFGPGFGTAFGEGQGADGAASWGDPRAARRPGSDPQGPVVRGEVVDEGPEPGRDDV